MYLDYGMGMDAYKHRHTIVNNGGGVSATLCFEWALTGLGENNERLIGWGIYLETGENAYITSAKQHQWSIDFAKLVDEEEYTQLPTISGYSSVNTDINDRITIAEGFLEEGYQSYFFEMDAIVSLDLNDAIFVDMKQEKGVNIGEKTGISTVMEQFGAYYGGYAEILDMNNFTDEDTPVMYYSGAGGSRHNYSKILTYISFNGATRHIEPREVRFTTEDKIGGYVFRFTDEEKTIIQKELANSKSKQVYVCLMSRLADEEDAPYSSADAIVHYVKRTMSIKNGEPVFSPVIKDTNETTIALTGNEEALVRFHSNAYVESNVEIQKHAGSLVEHSISIGNATTNDHTYTFNNVESNAVIFKATDSRGLTTIETINPPFVDYVKLSCYIDANTVDSTTNIMEFAIKGNYYNGTFGAVDNNLSVMYRLKVEDNEWGEWVVAPATLNNNTYTANVVIENLDYRLSYELQGIATDRLNVISSVIYPLTTVPIFDWSNRDFNFNVPVNFTKPITLQEGFGGDVVFHDSIDFKGEATFESDVSYGGSTTFTNAPTIGGNLLSDYVIETGTKSMGSNGTWKWQKWASGKAECWGIRNYGNMGFTTPALTLGWFQSAQTFSQSLPSIFTKEPDVINIDIRKGNNGAIVLQGIGTTADATSTGDFIVLKAADSTTLSQVHLGFHVIGTWKSEE